MGLPRLIREIKASTPCVLAVTKFLLTVVAPAAKAAPMTLTPNFPDRRRLVSFASESASVSRCLVTLTPHVKCPRIHGCSPSRIHVAPDAARSRLLGHRSIICIRRT